MIEATHSFDDSAAYERFMGRWSRAAGHVFLDWVAAPAGGRWLDVGCGTGLFTELILDRCAPAAVSAVDPSAAQIDHANRQHSAQRACFRVGDAQMLPFPDSVFDIVMSALVLNFIPDRARALAEMRRVARRGGIVAGYVWDFGPELSPSWPLRAGMRKFGFDVPDVPGTGDSGLGALGLLFGRAGLENVAARTIDVTLPYRDFDDFWLAQTPSYSPTTKMIAALTDRDRARLVDIVRDIVPVRPDGMVEYSARANALRGSVPD